MTNPIFLSILIFIGATTFADCPSSKKGTFFYANQSKCIQDILEEDERLGEIRNHACKEISLEKTIHNYVLALRQMDFSSCPKAFTDAFKSHIDAWEALIPEVNPFQSLRGEMHDVFDQIKASENAESFQVKLDQVWSTWSEVEKHI